MAIRNPILNPLRFYELGKEPDYVNYWPNPNNQNQRTKWVEGEKAVSWYKQFLLNKAVEFQIEVVSAGTPDDDLVIYKYNESTRVFDNIGTLAGTNITPQNYVTSTVIILFSYLPTISGVYYFTMPGQGYRSDTFVISERPKFVKRLVEIVYSNSENALGIIFESDYESEGTFENVYQGRQYFTGKLVGEPGLDVAGFSPDSGGFEKTQTTVNDRATLYLYDIHKSYLKHLNRLFACDNIEVNGVAYQNDDEIEKDEIEGTDLINVTVNLREKTNNDYYV